MEAQRAQMINHRGPEFEAIVKRVTLRLQYFFQTASPVLTYPASGTGATEAALVNALAPGDRVLSFNYGTFSAGIGGAAIAQALGPLKRAVAPSQMEHTMKLEVRLEDKGGAPVLQQR